MSHVVRCYCLFDITHTGVPNRGRPPVDAQLTEWQRQRNTQCNYDTLLQAISIRSQPEIDAHPQQRRAQLNKLSYFGNHYRGNTTYWTFEFSVQHTSVFNNGEHPLGALLADCSGVPMILCGTECDELPPLLHTDGPLKNIHFETLQ